ncbi:MAG: DNA polymerase III subunit delta, partial [Lachnospiraceae bacterium]|nr:DNA polymerase III subunit delta [Lachnospiraceae bacterium]
MGQIKEDIKSGSFKNMYLLFGEEAYLRNYYKKALRDALTTPDDTLNYSYFEGTNTNISEVVDLINTMPFMADHRVIICENTGWMAKEEGSENSNLSMLTDALETVSEDVVFILCELKADKRSKLFKLISKNGVTEEYKPETEENLTRWVMGYLKNCGKAIQPAIAMYLVSEVGPDMTLLSLELEKLAAWCLDRNEVTRQDVDTVCTHQVNGKIFDMITAISQKRQKEALRLYYDLMTLRESPFHIQSLLVRQYNNMLVIKDGLNRGYSAQVIAGKAGMQDWLV